jgi:membrane-associated HD superfamily phosphohydrolase
MQYGGKPSAKKIGANALLCLVGDYYHDIRKAEKAVYFQGKPKRLILPIRTILFRLKVSARIIKKSYLATGLPCAEKYRIPDGNKSYLSKHINGTSEITLFKAKARRYGN